jgi:hypothetical protein
MTEADGEAIIDTLVRRGPTHHAVYPGGHSCIFVGPSETVGTVSIRNSHIENMSSHGIYGSRTRGDIRIENTTFKNNNGAGVRISGPGSYIRNSDIVLDASEVIGGTLGRILTSATTGVWFESGFRTRAGGTIDGCRVDIRQAPDRTRGIEVDGSAGRTTITNTTVHAGRGDIRPIDINQPGREGARVRTEGSVPSDPRVDIRNVTITGESSGREAVIDVTGRDGVTVADTRLDFTGNRDGIRFHDVSGYTVTETEITLGNPGTGIVAEGSTGGSISATDISVFGVPVSVSMPSTPQECPLPIDDSSTFETKKLKYLVGSTMANNVVSDVTAADCLDHGDAFQNGGRIMVLRWDQTGTVLMLDE